MNVNVTRCSVIETSVVVYQIVQHPCRCTSRGNKHQFVSSGSISVPEMFQRTHKTRTRSVQPRHLVNKQDKSFFGRMLLYKSPQTIKSIEPVFDLGIVLITIQFQGLSKFVQLDSVKQFRLSVFQFTRGYGCVKESKFIVKILSDQEGFTYPTSAIYSDKLGEFFLHQGIQLVDFSLSCNNGSFHTLKLFGGKDTKNTFRRQIIFISFH